MAEAIGNQEYEPLKHLSMLRDTWSEEIPERVIHSDSRIDAKVRRNWFQGIVADVENALGEGEVKTAEAKAAAGELVTRFTSNEFHNQQLTKPEDIQEANRLIDIILGR